MAEQQQPEQKKEGLSLFQKAIFVILGILLIGIMIMVFFGGINNVYQFLIIIAFIFVIVIVGYVIMKAIDILLEKKKYSPKDDFYTRIRNIAECCKPDNVLDLYFIGSRMKKGYRQGRIIGCMQLPHHVGNPIKDINGNIVTKYSAQLKKDVPQFEKIVLGESCDTFFVVSQALGLFGFLFPKKHFIRCDSKLHSELNGDVFIYDVNPVPYGSFFQYPLLQGQRDAPKIMMQNQLEIILMTHEYQYDLISQAADIGAYFNPALRMIREQGQEIEGQV